MSSLDIRELKSTFMNTIRTYVYPQQLDHSGSLSLYSEGTIVQTLYIFSSTVDNMLIHCSGTLGSPSAATVKLYSGSKLLKSASTILQPGWNTIAVNKGDIVSRRKGSIVIFGGVSSGNDYYLSASTTTSTYYYGNAGTVDLAFSLGVRDFVYRVFPAEQIEQNSLPVVVLDIIGRPRVIDKYLSGKHIWMYVRFRAEVYSLYTDETDLIVSGIDHCLFRDRVNFSGLQKITPGPLTPLSFVRPEVFNRNVQWTVQKLVSR